MKNTKSKANIPRVIILRGSPGVGKSTIAMKVCTLLHKNKVARVSIDDLQHFDQRNACKDKFKLGIFHAAIVCRSFIQEGFDIVVDYVFDRDLDFFVDKLLRSHATRLPPCKIQIAYLDAKFDVVKKRNKNRKDPMPLCVLTELYECCNALKGQFPSEVVIDTTKLSPKGAAKKVLESRIAIVGCDKKGKIVLGEI